VTPPGGRPEIGVPINVRLGDQLLADIDARAHNLGVSRASMIRTLLTAAQSELDDDTIADY
jgi:metal-responsive CopG/Arc/MetJ family transcriptional regulator